MIKFFHILIDVLLISSGEFLAYIIRLGYPLNTVSMGQYVSNWFLIILIRIWALYTINAYSEKLRSYGQVVNQIIKAMIFSTISITAITFFNHSIAYPRSVILISFVITLMILCLAYFLFWKLRIVRKDGKNVVIIGATDAGKNVTKGGFCLKHWKIKGFIDDKLKKSKKVINKLKVLGNLNELKIIVNKEKIDLAVIAIPNAATENKLKVLTKCESINLNYIIIPSFYEIVTGRARLDEIDDLAILEPQYKRFDFLNIIIKRGFDFLFSLIIIVLLSPLLILIGALIKLTSRGPIIFKQRRAGKKGEPFYVYKFRTMVNKADKIGPILTEKNDSRITGIGNFLRRWSIDELPQFFNVLKGDMSVVGPRPEVVEIAKKYKAWQRRVLQVNPGITGYAQISGRQELSIDTKLKMDLFYINNFSFLLDMEIIFKTILEVFRGTGAY